MQIDKEGRVTGGGKKYEAYRLLYNEASYATNQADLRSYEEDEVPYYDIIAKLDTRPSVKGYKFGEAKLAEACSGAKAIASLRKRTCGPTLWGWCQRSTKRQTASIGRRLTAQTGSLWASTTRHFTSAAAPTPPRPMKQQILLP